MWEQRNERPAGKVSREKKQEAGYPASIYRELTNQRSPSSATALIITWKSIGFSSKVLYSHRQYLTLFITIQSFFAKAMICFLHNIEKIRGKSLSGLQKQLILIFLFVSFFNPMAQCCPGRSVNPLTDICWSCLFPLSIGPVKVNIGGREDTPNPSGLLCFCPKPLIPLPVPGIPVGFWEPVRLVDVTRIPFCMVGLGGLSLGNTFYKHGIHSKTWDQRSGVGRSFYHVHWYIYPVIYWLELLLDFLCLESASFDVAYLTELDPLWNDDETSFIINPEAVVFGNPLAQVACAADCAASSLELFPLDPLFWCGGCQGSLYPFTGTVGAHVGGVQASLLLVQRMAAKLHRQLLLWGTFGKAGLCGKYPMPIIKKSQYKIQMTYPIPTTTDFLACNPMGRTEIIWGSGREFPARGEDFGYLIWRKRNCCVL